MNIILSIHPKWADKIYKGEKKIEWRKTKPKWYDSKAKVYLYETAPVKKVTGYFMLERFGWVSMHDHDFKFLNMEVVEKLGCVSIESLKQYQGDSPELFAWYVGKVVRFKNPRPLSDFGLKRPPQSWQYVKEVEHAMG